MSKVVCSLGRSASLQGHPAAPGQWVGQQGSRVSLVATATTVETVAAWAMAVAWGQGLHVKWLGTPTELDAALAAGRGGGARGPGDALGAPTLVGSCQPLTAGAQEEGGPA